MVVVILGMVLALALALVVVALVAIPAVKDGETLLSREGQELVSDVKDRATGTVGSARDKVSPTS